MERGWDRDRAGKIEGCARLATGAKKSEEDQKSGRELTSETGGSVAGF